MPIAFIILLACSRSPAPAESPRESDVRPSFDCAHAASEVEHVVCEDEFLAKLDVALDRSYRDAPASGLRALRSQLHWLAARDACSAVPDVRACVLLAYTSRLRELCALTNPWCGVYADGTLDWNDPGFEGMSVVSIFPSDQYDSLLVTGTSIASNPARATCGVEMWTREVNNELLATASGVEPPCIAKLQLTRSGVRVDVSEGCQTSFCGAAASWGGEYRRLTEPADQRRWEVFSYE